MISRIDHVSIAVKDREKAEKFFTELCGLVPGVFAEDDNMKYRWQIYSAGDLSRLEIMNPTGEGSFLDNFLVNKEGGVHHLDFEVPDIYAAKDTLEEMGVPYFGFNDYGDIWKELFIHPRDAFGVLIQLAEFSPDDWLGDNARMEKGKKWEVKKNNDGATLTFAHPGGGMVDIELTPDEMKSLASELNNA